MLESALSDGLFGNNNVRGNTAFQTLSHFDRLIFSGLNLSEDGSISFDLLLKVADKTHVSFVRYRC